MVEKNVRKINRPHKFDFSFKMEKSLNQLANHVGMRKLIKFTSSSIL